MDYRKKIISDILPPSKSSTFRAVKPAPAKEKPAEQKEAPFPIHTYKPQKGFMGPGKKRALKILVMALIIAGGVFWGIRYFASIKIVIQPKENTFTLGKRMTVVVPAEIITLSLSKERRFI